MASHHYEKRIEGLRVTFTFHPRSGLWGGTIHSKDGRSTLPGASATTYREAEKQTKYLIRRNKARRHRPY